MTTRKNFKYYSKQIHTSVKDGEHKTKITLVKIKGNRGFKEVVQKKGFRTVGKTRKMLKQKEINCIRKCKFIPGLFKDCEKCL